MQSYSCLFGLRSVARIALLGVAMLTVACSGNDDNTDASGDRQTTGGQFLDAASYADVITISPSFPFGVTKKHAVTGGVLGAHWGNHGGPIVTTQDFVNPESPLKVSRLSMPTAATGEATRAELTSVLPTDVPAQRFWAADGFIDLPFGSLSMLSYSTSNAPFSGELFFYSKDYDRVVSRAHVNGYYGGVGVVDGATQRVLHTGLSGLSSTATAANESALYASNICGESVAPSDDCTASVKLFGWQGSSGPVTTDADGNVFVAAFVTGGAHSDAVYALAKAQAFSSTGARQATVADRDTGGTSSFAAVSKPGEGKGWLVAKGYDGDASAPAYARAYHSNGTEIVADGQVIESAISAPTEASTSLFSDPQGHLWVAVETASASWLLELEQKP
jgi:hypothetical protein